MKIEVTIRSFNKNPANQRIIEVAISSLYIGPDSKRIIEETIVHFI